MNKHRILLAAVMGFFVLVGVGVGVGGYMHAHRAPGGPWANHVFGGKITQVSTTDITVTDVRGTEKTFLMTPLTDVRKGKEVVSVDALSVGSFVVVDTAPAPDGQEAAREVRLLSTSTRTKTEAP